MILFYHKFVTLISAFQGEPGEGQPGPRGPPGLPGPPGPGTGDRPVCPHFKHPSLSQLLFPDLSLYLHHVSTDICGHGGLRIPRLGETAGTLISVK